MCGACGGGRVRGPWEDAVDGRGPRVLAARAEALQRLLAPWAWRVRPWSVSGYAVQLTDRLDVFEPAAVFLGKPYRLREVADTLKRLTLKT